MKLYAIALAFAATSPAQALQAQLVAHYRLDETSGTTLIDSGPHGFDGTFLGGFSLGQPGAATGTGTSVAFDGVDAMAEIQGGPALSALSGEISVSQWVFMNGLPQFAPLLESENAWRIQVVGEFPRLNTGTQKLTSSHALTSQTWAHLVIVFDSSFDATFYVDGQAVQTLTAMGPLTAPSGVWKLASSLSNSFPGGDWLKGALDDVQVYDGVLTAQQVLELFQNPGSTAGGSTIGTSYCGPAVSNSAGSGAVITAAGSTAVAANDVTLTASGLPANQFGYFLNSETQGFVFPVPNSQGALCLGGQVGRYNGQIQNSGATGEIGLVLDLSNTPTPTGTVAVMAGDTWNFTCWYRDNNPGPTSNFSDGVSITLN